MRKANKYEAEELMSRGGWESFETYPKHGANIILQIISTNHNTHQVKREFYYEPKFNVFTFSKRKYCEYCAGVTHKWLWKPF